jgi:3-oxoacyl-[acyl-carrier-protein] synthase II
VPPTANLEQMDPEISLDVARGEARRLADGPRAAVNNSFGFGGHDVALVFRSA